MSPKCLPSARRHFDWIYIRNFVFDFFPPARNLICVMFIPFSPKIIENDFHLKYLSVLERRQKFLLLVSMFILSFTWDFNIDWTFKRFLNWTSINKHLSNNSSCATRHIISNLCWVWELSQKVVLRTALQCDNWQSWVVKNHNAVSTECKTTWFCFIYSRRLVSWSFCWTLSTTWVTSSDIYDVCLTKSGILRSFCIVMSLNKLLSFII